MGRSQAEGMAENVREGRLTIEAALRWHLYYNHCPPVDAAFIPACLEALDMIRDDCGDDPVALPNGRTITAWQVFEALHLEGFLED